MRISRLFTTALLALATLSTHAQQGAWNGELNVMGTKLPLVFNFSADGCTIDSPTQGAKGIPAQKTTKDDGTIKVTVPMIGATFEGKMQNNEIKGTYTQNGFHIPLTLKPGQLTVKRPQTPVAPFPYKQESVSFTNAGYTFNGTLTLPQNYSKQTPVVLMVTGSGQQNRDEELFGHKPFWVIADQLARHGIASLRYDDRGVGGSTGQVKGATTYDNMSDALAVVEYLRKQGRFGKIGILGHSEGGTIGYMIAARKKADFVVSLAGPALRGDSILVMQNRDMLRSAGLDSATVSVYCTALSRILAYKRTARMEANPELTLATLTIGLTLPEPLKANLIEVIKSHDAWTDYFAAYDPSADVNHTTCPVMAVGGSRDLQVNTQANLQAVNRLLPHPTGNGKWARYHFVKEYQGLNHLLQPATTGMPTEYGQIETTLSEEVLTDLCQWLSELR